MPRHQYTASEYSDMLLIYGECHGNAAETIRIYRERYNTRVCPTNGRTVVRAFQRIRENRPLIGSSDGVSNVKLRGSRHEDVLNYFERNPKTSLRMAARHFKVHHKTILDILKRQASYNKLSEGTGSSIKPRRKKHVYEHIQPVSQSDAEVEDDGQCSWDSQDDASEKESDDESTKKPTGYTCDSCEDEIFGFRYTCVQCTSFDLCVHCEALREHADHYMLRIPSGKCNTETKRMLKRIRADLDVNEPPKDEPEYKNEESNVVMEFLDIKEDPLPDSYLPEDTGFMVVTDSVSGPHLLNSKRNDQRTVSKRKKKMNGDNAEFQPKVKKESRAAVDASIMETTDSDNTTIKIETKEEVIDTEDDSSSAASQVAPASSSSIVSVVNVPQVKLEPNVPE